MTEEELLTGEESKKWVEDLPDLIEVLNENKKIPLKKEISEDPIIDKYTGELLEIGQNVRIQLDYPIDNVENKRLHGKFRTTDIKWTPKIYKITEVLLKPGFPPMYLTDADDNVARTKSQLQVVDKDIKEGNPKFIRGKPEHYLISKILDKRKKNNKIEYLVKWKGYDIKDASWIPNSELSRTKELKDMRKEFNNIINN